MAGKEAESMIGGKTFLDGSISMNKRRGMVQSKNKSNFSGMYRSGKVATSQQRSFHQGGLDRNYMSQKMTSSGIPKNLEIKYRKDMQQLKFYQTLNNYQNAT